MGDKRGDERIDPKDADEGVAAAHARFDDLVREMVGIRGVSPPPGGSGFGRAALRIDGKMFAMLARGRLVVKIPASRVDEFVQAGEGARFDANRRMRQWLSLDPHSELEWADLAREALEFVRG